MKGLLGEVNAIGRVMVDWVFEGGLVGSVGLGGAEGLGELCGDGELLE